MHARTLSLALLLSGCCLFKEKTPQEIETTKRATAACEASPGKVSCRECCQKNGSPGGTYIDPNAPGTGKRKATACRCF